MAVLTHLETDTGTNVDISGATAVGTYTANGDKLIMVDVSIDAVAGNGDYVMYLTRQIGGSGSAYRILPQTTMAAASGLTAISGQSGWITVRNGDVLTCYVDGLAGDTSTPDWTTRWFESAVTLVTLADDAITASKFDESTAYPLKSADTGATQVARVGADSDTLETLSDEIAAVKAETALIVADTGTDGVKINATQGAITWGQQKIVANVAGEGALDIENTSTGGLGGVGIRAEGEFAGQYNAGSQTKTSAGQFNTGMTGVWNEGSTGQRNTGSYKAVEGYDPALALEATLTAIKGDGWTNQTLVKIITDISNISAGSGATPQQIWEYATRTLSEGVTLSSTLPISYPLAMEVYGVTGDLSYINGIYHLVRMHNDRPLYEAYLANWNGQIYWDTSSSTWKISTSGGGDEAHSHSDVASPDLASFWKNASEEAINVPILPLYSISPEKIWLNNTRTLTAGTNIDLSSLATAANLATLDGKVDTIDGVVDAIKAKSDLIPASPAEAGEYTAAIAALQTDLDNPDQYKADVSGLATTAHVQEVEDKVDTAVQSAGEASYYSSINSGTLGQVVSDTAAIAAVKAKTDQLTFTAANKVDATATTDTSSIAGDVWSYAKRTLTHPSVSAEEPEDSNTLILYRDADIAIELTDLTIPAGAKKYIFTIKDNLDSGDEQAVLQASYAIDGSEVETNTLVYINSAAAPVLTNPVTFTLTDTNITIDLTAEAAALLPRYERGYLNWDLKLVTDAAVTIVLQGLAQIIGTSTRAIE